jgi:ketosteroid isomerase-like protein
MTMDDKAACEAVVKRIWDRFLARDPQGMLACLHADCTIWDVFQPQLVTRRDLEAYVDSDYGQSMARGPLSHVLDDFVTDVWDDAAVVRFLNRFEYKPPNALRGHIRITCVLRRFPRGGWLVVHVHEGDVPAGIPPITEK